MRARLDTVPMNGGDRTEGIIAVKRSHIWHLCQSVQVGNAIRTFLAGYLCCFSPRTTCSCCLCLSLQRIPSPRCTCRSRCVWHSWTGCRHRRSAPTPTKKQQRPTSTKSNAWPRSWQSDRLHPPSNWNEGKQTAAATLPSRSSPHIPGLRERRRGGRSLAEVSRAASPAAPQNSTLGSSSACTPHPCGS